METTIYIYIFIYKPDWKVKGSVRRAAPPVGRPPQSAPPVRTNGLLLKNLIQVIILWII